MRTLGSRRGDQPGPHVLRRVPGFWLCSAVRPTPEMTGWGWSGWCVPPWPGCHGPVGAYLGLLERNSCVGTGVCVWGWGGMAGLGRDVVGDKQTPSKALLVLAVLLCSDQGVAGTFSPRGGCIDLGLPSVELWPFLTLLKSNPGGGCSRTTFSDRV